MTQIKNLIFDIGDVIIDIDYQTTIAEFQKLAKVDFSEIVSYSKQHPLFDQFERGEISAQEFRTQLKPFLKEDTTDEAINQAWNAILIHYPKAKFDLLLELKKRYRTFALSNINEIHVMEIDRVAEKCLHVSRFADFFHRAFYSNEVGHRKPELAVYEFVMHEENLLPSETLFIDDKAENIAAAKALGWHAHQLTNRNKLKELLTELNIL